MNYKTEIYFQANKGEPHRLVTPDELRQEIGEFLADRQIAIANERIANTESRVDESLPELTAFFRGDRAKALALANYTPRGNVWIEVSEC
ncbi:hypothetical protein [Paenibacillus donghaensis]|uniref:Uncharacterized protein n=1 Tax=Paenibacillus donghaensis TaxID=414771 RepID=A0A2Z2KG40_9BACL|nr:hypothetical protein [Paenibacillus donghaensis]ASA22110.1 hypothetical protein B9T62_15780 [Paenibacillus donghaensis]